MSIEYLYLAGIALPFVGILGMVLSILVRFITRLQKRIAVRRRRREILSRLPEVVRRSVQNNNAVSRAGRWEGYLEQQLARTGWKITPTVFAGVPVALALFGVAVGVFVLKDIMMTIAVIVVLIFIPFLLLNWGAQNYEQKTINQLPTAINLFAVEYELDRDLRGALLKSAEGVNDPLRGYLKSCARELAASRPPREALGKLARRLNCEYSRIWAQMLLASQEDSTVIKLMPRLITMLNGQRLLQQKNILELSGERRIGIILNILIVPAFLTTQLFLPGTAGFYTQPFGRLVIILVFLSVVVGISLDQLLRRVDL